MAAVSDCLVNTNLCTTLRNDNKFGLPVFSFRLL
jgi:hypothetical protein